MFPTNFCHISRGSIHAVFAGVRHESRGGWGEQKQAQGRLGCGKGEDEIQGAFIGAKLREYVSCPTAGLTHYKSQKIV